MTDEQLKEEGVVLASIVFFTARIMEEKRQRPLGYMNVPGFSERTFGWFDITIDTFIFAALRSGQYTEQESWMVRNYAYGDYSWRWIVWRRGH